MNPIRRLFKMFIKKDNSTLKINRPIGIIQPTEVASDNNTIDKFNKVILIREGVEIVGKEIRWGRILRETSYSEEKRKALNQVYEIPIVERKLDGKISFFQEKDFGEIQTLI